MTELSKYFNLEEMKVFEFVKEGAFTLEDVIAILPLTNDPRWVQEIEGKYYAAFYIAAEFNGDTNFKLMEVI